MNYELLLRKFIRHVEDCEGTTCVGMATRSQRFTREEVTELLRQEGHLEGESDS